MKKQYIVILGVIILIIFMVISIWTIAYPYFLKKTDNSTRQSFIDETMLYLSTDEEFISKYGPPVSINSNDKLPIKNTDSKLTQYYMDFTCVTENDSFSIRVYHTWIDTWTYSYEIMDTQ